MAYYMYNNFTGELKEVSEELMYDGCPLTGMAITFNNHSVSELLNDFVWDTETRDFIPRT